MSLLKVTTTVNEGFIVKLFSNKFKLFVYKMNAFNKWIR